MGVMRSYLDNYINSLSSGEKVLADKFIWKDRILEEDLESLTASTPYISTRYGEISPLTQVKRNDFVSIFSQTKDAFSALFARANHSAAYREALDIQVENKLKNIESALEKLENEVDSWEDKLSSSAEASYTISRNFGQEGLRPVVEYENTLELISTTVTANTDITHADGLIKATCSETLDEEFFLDNPGLQVRFVFNFTPGKVDKIHLEPLSGIDNATIYQLRLYGSQGNLLDFTVDNEELNRTLEYSIPSSVISRIEIDLYCETYNITEELVTNTVEKTNRIVIPSKTEKKLVGYKEVTYTIPGFDYGLTGPRPVSQQLDPNTGMTYQEQVIAHNPVYSSVGAALSTGIYTYGNAFWVYGGDGKVYQYSYERTPTTTKTTLVPVYETTTIPEQILLESYTETTETLVRKYNYELGLKNIRCTSSYYTESLSLLELIKFDGGIPTSITLMTNEYLPVGSYINFYLIGKDDIVTPLAAYNREWTTDVLNFDRTGQAALSFYPTQELYFYRDEDSTESLPLNGRYVLGPQANSGVSNPMLGSVHWVRYQPDMNKCNIIPYTSRVGSYFSKDGSMGEYFEEIPSSKKLTLSEKPYVDSSRVNTDDYSPISIIIDGYNTSDLTNYSLFEEEEFPISPVYSDNERTIHYKVRDKTIFFDTEVSRPVRIFYEFEAQYAYLLINIGVVHKRAACPALYSYQLSYI